MKIAQEEVVFWAKDLKTKQRVQVLHSTEEFVAALAEHVHDRYRHAIRYFGLLAPVSKGRTYTGLFLLLGQDKRPRPRRLSWAISLRKHFGVDPLRDTRGQSMHWVSRLKPDLVDFQPGSNCY